MVKWDMHLPVELAILSFNLSFTSFRFAKNYKCNLRIVEKTYRVLYKSYHRLMRYTKED